VWSWVDPWKHGLSLVGQGGVERVREEREMAWVMFLALFCLLLSLASPSTCRGAGNRVD